MNSARQVFEGNLPQKVQDQLVLIEEVFSNSNFTNNEYSPVTDHESKLVILANPPFGAERDQEAYPDVWQEYSKESETTTLFVKLMFEHLKQGGKCAVVVSEVFILGTREVPKHCAKCYWTKRN